MTDDVEMLIFGQLSQIREELAQIREHLYGTRKPGALDRADQNGLQKRLVLRRIQLIQYDTSLLAFPAKAGIYFRHGHRPSPVWQDVVLCVIW